MNLIHNIISPTPNGWKKVRNIATTVVALASVAATLPISGTALAVVSAIGGVAAIIAGTQTITPKRAGKMKTHELSKMKDDLVSMSWGKGLNPKQSETLKVVKDELSKRV